ncbi:uncharacterized protein LOC122947060 [Acropora millepora]|uniref:uncharacterized protein LOC122947060 n=1 Tax=Acropora millepora TaxID=45264 RepID=UPI001CF132BD|nr:uncharacterized protein LOC122947060 [Acropora millepora]
MDKILRELNLGTLVDRFDAEKIEPDNVISASDSELTRLGVSTIGDRIRLRELCSRAGERADLEVPSASTSINREERLALFNPRRQGRGASGSDSKRRKTAVTKSKPWTAHFVCLADRFCLKTPTSVEKQILFKAGLGPKKIKLDLEDDESTVKEKISSDTLDSHGEPEGFPALRTCGGFELMQCSPNCRDLTRIRCAWNARDLRANLGGGQGKIYVVPIQNSLSTIPLVQKCAESALKEKCNKCKKEILVRELRKHMWECEEDSDNDTDDSVMYNSVFRTRPTAGTSTTTTAVPSHVPSGSATPAYESQGSQSFAVVSVTESTSTAINQGPTDPSSVNPGDGGSNSVPTETLLPVVDMSVDQVVKKTVHYCQTHDVHNPTEILRCFQQNMVTGRDLEVENPLESIEGETNFIMVDRSNLLQTAFDEINCLQDYRKTLEV